MTDRTFEQEVKKWYNREYQLGFLRRKKRQKKFNPFLSYLNVKAGRRILDIGSGRGNLLKDAEEKGLETFGIDISSEAVKSAHLYAQKSELQVASGEYLPYKDCCFDYVTLIGTLEHLIHMGKGIREVILISKNKAKICILVPNSSFPFTTVSVGSRRIIFFGKGARTDQIQETLLSFEEWSRFLKDNGLVIYRIFKDETPYYASEIFSSRVLQTILKGIIRLIYSIIPLCLSMQLIFVCGKKPKKCARIR